MIRNFTLRGWFDRPSADETTSLCDGVHLLSRRQISLLFPDADILVERFLGLPKSYIAYRKGVG